MDTVADSLQATCSVEEGRTIHFFRKIFTLSAEHDTSPMYKKVHMLCTLY